MRLALVPLAGVSHFAYVLHLSGALHQAIPELTLEHAPLQALEAALARPARLVQLRQALDQSDARLAQRPVPDEDADELD